MSKLLISLHFLLFLVMSSGISLGWQEWNGPAFEAPTDPFEQAFDSNEVTVPESEKLKQLEQRIADLEKALLENSTAVPDDSQGKGRESEKKSSKEESNAKWNVKLGGHVQADFVHWADASPSIPDAENYFEFRRLRLVADGTGYEVLDFRLQMTLEPESVGETQPVGLVTSPDVKDAYLSVNEIPGFGRFRVGNFFVPFSLEQVTNDTNNAFLERSIPTQGVFSPDREVGMAFYNATNDKNATLSYGIFLDSISESLKEKIDDNQGLRLSCRGTWLPYYDESTKGRYLWHTGVGILHTDDQDGRVRFRARPQIREGPRLIDSGNFLADEYTTGNIETAIISGPLSIQGEAFISSVDRRLKDRTEIGGAYLYLSYFLTGENRIFERFGQHGAQFARNVPNENLFLKPGCFGPGAWEFKTRWSYLDLNNLDAGQYNDITVGFNWYWTDRTRVMFDWIHPITTRDSVFGDTTSDIIALRFDWNW
jgi:phosphate-selective porin OprO/OprP